MHSRKKAKAPRRGASIDGIVTDQRRLGVPVNRNSQPRDRPAASLGQNLSRAEGFYPMRAGSGSLGSQEAIGVEKDSLEEPIILDDKTIKKDSQPRLGKERPRWRRIFKRTTLLILASIFLGGLYVGYKTYKTQRSVLAGGGTAPAVCDSNVSTDQLKTEGDARVNTLLLGIGGTGHDGPNLTDTVMVASLDPYNKRVELLSLPRDLWVKIPGYGSQKINAAYAYGKEYSKSKDPAQAEKDGINLVDQVLENTLGIPIHFHAVVDFQAFKEVVDALGGITVNVPEQLYDPSIAWENKYNPIIAKPGVQTFDGARALLYAKSRETSSDFARGERQRLLLVAMKDKALSAGTYSNPVKVVNLMNSLGKNVYTDFNTASIKCLYHQVSEIPSTSIVSLDLVKEPNVLVTTGNLNGISIVQPKAGLFDYGAIQKFVRTSLRDSFLAKENSAVAIYNATSTAGLATKTSDTLKSYGYNVVAADNAPNQTNPATTVLVDLSHGQDKYTRNYLEHRFKLKAQGSLPAGASISPPEGTKFVIILGKDAEHTSPQ